MDADDAQLLSPVGSLPLLSNADDDAPFLNVGTDGAMPRHEDGDLRRRDVDDMGESARDTFFKFLTTFRRSSPGSPSGSQGGEEATYVQEARNAEKLERSVVYVSYVDLLEFDPDLADLVREDYARLEPFLRQAAKRLFRTVVPEYASSARGVEREFFVGFYDLPFQEQLRDFRASWVGQLVAFEGTVTRTSEVRPELFSAAFTCGECQTRVAGVEQQYKYTQPTICSNANCGNRTKWILNKEHSVFIDWQRAKVQENNDEVPAGCLPRTMEIILRNELVEQIRPGDNILFTGTIIVIPDVSVLSTAGEKIHARGRSQLARLADGVTGLREAGVRELTYRMGFLATSVLRPSQREGVVNIRDSEDSGMEPEDVLEAFSEEQQEDIAAMKADPSIYENLAKSIAPSVYGHEDIKRAILLMLVGGVHKQTGEGINLRGDINVCIVGDPACAKSQFLKYVSDFLPRAVYTTGKSSSAAGLTASVVKEPDSRDFCIEAGALMLADNGICCIDEFDKMESKDQVAIHEAMEQQTISISKAGIQATLNARASILAAANPIGGRYDKSKPLKWNVNLPPAILSRFDLLHVMVDDPNVDSDDHIAWHIMHMHQHMERAVPVPYSKAQVQLYIRFCRSIRPRISQQAKRVLINSYKMLRNEDAAPGSRSAYRITVRQLEALIRMSEALARLRCNGEIQAGHVKEARRLLKNSLNALETPDIELEDMEGDAQEQPVVPNADAMDIENEPGAENVQERPTSPPPGSTPGRDRQPLLERPERGQNDMDMEDGKQGRNVEEERKQKPEKKKITQQRFFTIQKILVHVLRQQEEEALSAGSTATVGMRQKELSEHYLRQQIERRGLQREDAQEEAEVVGKVIAMLIAKHDVLVVAYTPERQEGESLQAYNRRKRMERVLAVNPMYTEAD